MKIDTVWYGKKYCDNIFGRAPENILHESLEGTVMHRGGEEAGSLTNHLPHIHRPLRVFWYKVNTKNNSIGNAKNRLKLYTTFVNLNFKILCKYSTEYLFWMHWKINRFTTQHHLLLLFDTNYTEVSQYVPADCMRATLNTSSVYALKLTSISIISIVIL